MRRDPGAKPGRCWIFIEDDLAEYVRSLYAPPRQALQVTLRKEWNVTSQTRRDLVGRRRCSQWGASTPNYWDCQ